MRSVVLVVLSGLLLAADAPARDEAERAWLLRTSRMEGASVNVEEAARELAAVAEHIAAGGRVTAMSELLGAAGELHRRVASASLAAQVLDEP